MPRRLTTKGGNTKRRKTVELDTKGLRTFEHMLGKNGVTFKLGLFHKEAARRGALLEFGTDRQVPRPWLSSVLSPNSPTRRKILERMKKLVQDAAKGKNSKNEVAKELIPILQRHLHDQDFQATKLTDSTIRQKTAKGNTDPEKIGIDTFQMATHLDVRSTGGKGKPRKKK